MGEFVFEGDGEELAAALFPAGDDAACTAVLLHGAGTGTKERLTARDAHVRQRTPR